MLNANSPPGDTREHSRAWQVRERFQQCILKSGYASTADHADPVIDAEDSRNPTSKYGPHERGDIRPIFSAGESQRSPNFWLQPRRGEIVRHGVYSARLANMFLTSEPFKCIKSFVVLLEHASWWLLRVGHNKEAIAVNFSCKEYKDR